MDTVSATNQPAPAPQVPSSPPPVPPQPVPVPTPAPLPIHATKSSNVMVFLVMLLLAACGLYYLGAQMKQPPKSAVITKQPAEAMKTEVGMPQTTSGSTGLSASQGQTSADWQTYTDTTYGLTLQYPPTWQLSQEKDRDGNPQVLLSPPGAVKAAFSDRKLPELFIGLSSPYSTAMSVCENQTCTETVPLTVNINSKYLPIPVTKGEVMQDGTNKFDFYAFIVPIPDKTYQPQGSSSPMAVYAVGSFQTWEEGQTISNILSTLTY